VTPSNARRRTEVQRLPTGHCLRCANLCDHRKTDDQESLAIQAPARQIIDNAGADGAVGVGKLLEANEGDC
jgi:hypothetical protein